MGRALGYSLAAGAWAAQIVLYPLALGLAFQAKAWTDWMAEQADREDGR